MNSTSPPCTLGSRITKFLFSNRFLYLPVTLLGFLPLRTVALEREIYYDITFEEAKHIVGQPPATGEFDSPSTILSGSPEVVNFGDGKALKLNAPLAPDQPSTESIGLTLDRDLGQYVLEYDLHIENLVLEDATLGEFFGTRILDAPSHTQNFFFKPFSVDTSDLRLDYFQYSPPGQGLPDLSGELGTYELNQSYHVKIEVNTVDKTWIITVDGEEKLNGTIYVEDDVNEIRLELSDRWGNGDSTVYLDNIVVRGPPVFETKVFDITFEETKHRVGSHPSYGGINGPSLYTGGSPEVAEFQGNKVLKLDSPAVPGGYVDEGIRLDLDYESKSYVLDYDLYIDDMAINPSPVSESFRTVVRQYSNQTLYFQPLTDQEIRYFQQPLSGTGSPTLRDTIGSYEHDVWYHLRIEVDTTEKTWKIYVDDELKLDGPIYILSDLYEITLHLYDKIDDGNAVVYVDNICITVPGPPSPSPFSVSQGTFTDRAQVTWAPVEGATDYEVFRGTSSNRKLAELIGATGGSLVYEDHTAEPGTDYNYWVRSISYGTKGPVGSSASGFRLAPPAEITGILASDGTLVDRVELSWDATALTETYHIFRSLTNDPASAVQIDSTTLTTYDDVTAVPGEHYYYWIKGENAAGIGEFSSVVTGFRSDVQPDMLIGISSVSLNGDDVYSNSGSNQSISLKSKKRRLLRYIFVLENDGTIVDQYISRANIGNRFFQAVYRNSDSQNITAQLSLGAYSSPILAVDAREVFQLDVKPKRKIRGKRKTQIFAIKAASLTIQEKTDAVRAISRTAKERKKRKKRPRR